MVGSTLIVYYKQKRYGFAGFAIMALGIVLINIMFLNKAEFKEFKLENDAISKLADLKGKVEKVNNKQLNDSTLTEGLKERVDYLIDLIETNPSFITQKNDEKSERFQKNSQYQVIIFYKDKSELANEIKNSLLSQGYLVTTTQTDFKEVPEIYNPGTIRIVYTSTGEGGKDGVLKVLEGKGYSEKRDNLTTKGANTLKSGNIQVYIF